MKRVITMLGRRQGKTRMRQILEAARESLDYAKALEQTPAGDRQGWPELRAWALPMCWIRGHAWGSSGAFEISPHRLQWCDRCREEVAHRTAWAQLEPMPMDGEDLPWFGFDPAEDHSAPLWLGVDWAREDLDR